MPEYIQTILQNVTEDGWFQKLACIETGMAKYENNRLDRPADQIGQIVEDYLNPILPTYWEVFHTHNTARWNQGLLPNSFCYDVGIFLVGFSSLPIALSLAEIQPREQIYFLYSKDTKDTLYEIGDRIREMLYDSNPSLVELVTNTVLCNLDTSALEIDNPSDPVATFKRIKEVIDKVGDKRIALDLTGGKKTMIGGGFTAGAILTFADSIRSAACDMFYIDSLEYDADRAAPVPGTEFLSLLENPYDVYNVQSTREAEKLFEQHNYKAAASLWKNVKDKLESHAKRYGLEDEQKAVQSDLGMANCYRLWDAFDYEAAKDCKAFLFDENRKGFWGYNEKHVRDSIDVLDILGEVGDRKTLFEKEERVIHYAVDRYQNAIRRKESGQLDDAIVRFTQVVEILCNYKIYQIASVKKLVENNGNPVDVEPKESWHLSPLIRFLFGKLLSTDESLVPPETVSEAMHNNVYRKGNRFYWITVKDCCLDSDDYGYESVDKITKLIESRNDFIHVNRAMTQDQTKENTDNLQALARNFLENFSCSYCCSKNLSFKDLLDLHTFRPASLLPVEQLAEELDRLTCVQVDEDHATQIYNEKLQSLEGNDQQMIAKALKAYWKNISKWEGNLSDKQREKVCIVQSILNEE